MPRLGYTIQVLHEALRLCPPAAGVARLATRDIAVDGYRVEAGSLVAVGLYALHHDPTLWPDPMVFDPDRFSPENSKGRNRWQFLPFLGGGRPCIGEHFARLETTLALATIVRALEIRSVEKDFLCDVPFTTVAEGAHPGTRAPAELGSQDPCMMEISCSRLLAADALGGAEQVSFDGADRHGELFSDLLVR